MPARPDPADAADCIAAYHDLLTDDLAGASQAMLVDRLRHQGLVFGDRPLATVLRPRFMTPEQYRELRMRMRILLRALRKAGDAAIADPAFRGQLRLADWEEQLAELDPGFPAASPTSRLDAFVTDRIAIAEYNAETPAGAAYNDALADVFLDLPVMRAFLRRYEVQPVLARHGVVHALLEAYERWAGHRGPPRVAIVDWPDVPTRTEFILYERHLTALGLECTIADPRALDYRRGKLYAASGPIDLVYKRVLLNELVTQCGLDGALVRAVRDRAVCMVNPFRCKLLHKKACLAVLSDKRNQALFEKSEQAAIDAHVPWTRVVEERRTAYGGREVDLLPFIAEHRERFVLKPNDDYGGAGVVLGWQVDGAVWEGAVRKALATPHVVQERVGIPSEPYPAVVNAKVEVADRMFDTAPFVCHGEYVHGCLTRLSTTGLLNVTSGGGSTVPLFLVEKR